MATQSLRNHRQIVWSWYLFTGVPMLVLAGIGLRAAIRGSIGEWEIIASILIAALIFLTMLFRNRIFALKAQDRAIRAEENLRYFVLTGKLYPPALLLGQIIALRFASDDELPKLTQMALDEKLSPNDIKGRIRHWRADLYRV